MSDKRLTNSEMKLWRRCKRSWWLTYHRKLVKREQEFGTPLSIGTRVHTALQRYYDPALKADPVETVKASVEEDCEEFEYQEDNIRKEGALCLIMVEGYVQWLAEEGADQGLQVIESESAREAPLVPGVRLLAKLDARIYREFDGAKLALEHKTVQSLSTALPTLQLDTQLLTEHLVEFLALKEEGKEEERAQGVLYNQLRKTRRTATAKPPFYGRETVMHNMEELRNHWRHVVAVAAEIDSAHKQLDADPDSHHSVTPPNPTRDCSWDCAFFRICPMFDDGSQVEPAIADLYATGDPLARYNEEK